MGFGLLDRLRKNRPKPLLTLLGGGQRKGLREVLTERRNQRLGIVSDDNPEDPHPEPAEAATTTEADKDVVEQRHQETPDIKPEEPKPLPEKETTEAPAATTEKEEKVVPAPEAVPLPPPSDPEPKKSEEEKNESKPLTLDEMLETVPEENKPQVTRAMKKWYDNSGKGISR